MTTVCSTMRAMLTSILATNTSNMQRTESIRRCATSGRGRPLSTWCSGCSCRSTIGRSQEDSKTSWAVWTGCPLGWRWPGDSFCFPFVWCLDWRAHTFRKRGKRRYCRRAYHGLTVCGVCDEGDAHIGVLQGLPHICLSPINI